MPPGLSDGAMSRRSASIRAPMAFCVRSKILDEERTMAVDNELARLSTPVSARDHAEGSEGAVVTLVEYGDYECPHCGRAYPIVKEIQKRLGSRLRFVFRNFPLVQIHPHAQHAAEAAEAAAAQGKFWEMHDVIFEHQNA